MKTVSVGEALLVALSMLELTCCYAHELGDLGSVLDFFGDHVVSDVRRCGGEWLASIEYLYTPHHGVGSLFKRQHKQRHTLLFNKYLIQAAECGFKEREDA